MELVDAHTHVFEEITGYWRTAPIRRESYGWAGAGGERLKLLPTAFSDSRSPVELLITHMDECGVARAVLTANPLYGIHNEYLRRCVEQYPDRLRAMALVDVLGDRRAAEKLEKIYRDGRLFGMKFEVERSFQFAPETQLSDRALEPVWECCEAYEQPVYLHLSRASDLTAVDLLAGRYPRTRFILCHLGADACFGPGAESGSFERMLEIAGKNSNLYADLSSVPDRAYFEEDYPFPSAVSRVVRAWRVFGARRLLWGSDYPGMLKFATYRQLINYVRCGCTEIPEADMEWIMGKNAEELFFGGGGKTEQAVPKEDEARLRRKKEKREQRKR